ncbi:hypothetical protein GRF29_1g2104714 [Pseudopithomyces chartarum]|uniref:Uncharacterized protein n=1 Tax=Pseudopithomyces chartarum TaxID=1892770 RepID=A0AAN6M654_9PLEO|nr:hypothetical protein GRF29_1g2104714 [Pseudopithomyces chartarum]
MRAPKALFGIMMAISFEYLSAANESNIPTEDTTVSSASLDSSMETPGTVASSLRPSATSYDSAFSGGNLSGASFTVVTIYPVFSLDSQGSTKVATDTRPAIVFPVIDSAGQTVLVTSTIFDTSNLSPYTESAESVSASQATPTSDHYSSSPRPSSVEIPETLSSTELSTLTSSFTTDISLTQPSTDIRSSVRISSRGSQGSFSAPLRPVSDSTTIMKITPSAPYLNSTASSVKTGIATSQPPFSAPLRPVSNSTTIPTVPTSAPYPNTTTSSPPTSTPPPPSSAPNPPTHSSPPSPIPPPTPPSHLPSPPKDAPTKTAPPPA